MPALTCPYCKAYANFSVQNKWERLYETGPRDLGGRMEMGTWLCQACGMPVTGEGETDSRGEFTPVEYQPKSVAGRKYPDGVPKKVAADASESHVCLSVGAWRAAAAMARRAIQAAAFEQEAPEKKLQDQIDWLAEHGRITVLMKEVGHRIRLGGNLGAHPDKDGLKDVSPQDAEDLLEFMDDFIKYLYEIPARLRAVAGVEEAPQRDGS